MNKDLLIEDYKILIIDALYDNNLIDERIYLKCHSPCTSSNGSRYPRKTKYDNFDDCVKEVSAKYGLKVSDYNDINDPVLRKVPKTIILKDEENNVEITFRNYYFDKVVNMKNDTLKDGDVWDYEDIIKAYSDLPSSLKENVSNIVFEYFGDYDYEDDGESVTVRAGFANSIDKRKDIMAANTVHIGYDTVLKYNKYGATNYPLVLAHELIHTLDYPHLTPEQQYDIKRVIGHEVHKWKKPLKKEQKTFDEFDKLRRNDKTLFTLTYGDYEEARRKNTEYQIKQGYIQKGERSKSSDYGSTLDYEDCAECGAMVTMGFLNPHNPYAVLKYNNKEIQYRDWIKMNPYTAQCMVKKIFGKDVSIDALLAQAK